MNGRDDKGRFAKGHHIGKGNNGANVGRKREIKTQVRDALALAEEAMPEIIEEMIKRAQDPLNRDSQRASEYLIDRVYGKASQPIAGTGDIVFRVVYDSVVSDVAEG